MSLTLKFLSLLLGAFSLHVLLSLEDSNYKAFARFKSLDRLEHSLAAEHEVLFFGDSVSYWVAGDDTDKRTLVELLQDKLTLTEIGHIRNGAMHAGVFLPLFEKVMTHSHEPALVIIPINLRSFSLEWDQRPEYQFSKATFLIRYGDTWWFRYFARPLTAYGVLNLQPVSQSDYDRMPVFVGDVQQGHVRDYLGSTYKKPTEDKIRNIIAFQYMYSLEPDHRKLAQIEQIVRLAGQSKTNILFFITPIDVEAGTSHLGEAFRKQVDANLTTLRKRLDQMGAQYIDLATKFPTELFDYNGYPNEHLNQEGRHRLAKRLAATIKRNDLLTK
jgi:lysophospholipase L1-like esterase